MDNTRPTWAEIDIAAIQRNLSQIRSKAGKAQVMAVVKANAYGHGVKEVVRTCAAGEVDFLGVATLDEAMELREAGFKLPILVLGYMPASQAAAIVENDIRATIFSLELAEAMAKQAERLRRPAHVHIKVDTGMGRLGLLPDREALDLVGKLSSIPHLNLEGIFTHFAAADCADKEYTHFQLNQFNSFTAKLAARGINIPIRHCSNSAALMDMPEAAHLNMVRAGIVLYGLYPSPEVDKGSFPITPAMRLKSKLVAIKELDKGQTVSYGRTYQCQEPTRVAVVPIGYADGYSRRLSNQAWGMVRGQRVPLIGTVCMDQCMFDITGVKEAREGDEILLFGRPEDGITADDLAGIIGTINYEVVCAVSGRVPRIYCQAIKD